MTRARSALEFDIRGRGGYVVVPPSIHPVTKREYCWDGLRELEDQPIAPAPAWLLDLLRRHQAQPARPASEPLKEKITKGSRHNTLVSIAGKLRRVGMSAEEMFLLSVTNRQRLSLPTMMRMSGKLRSRWRSMLPMPGPAFSVAKFLPIRKRRRKSCPWARPMWRPRWTPRSLPAI